MGGALEEREGGREGGRVTKAVCFSYSSSSTHLNDVRPLIAGPAEGIAEIQGAC
jgi:hypothetical protein